MSSASPPILVLRASQDRWPFSLGVPPHRASTFKIRWASWESSCLPEELRGSKGNGISGRRRRPTGYGRKTRLSPLQPRRKRKGGAGIATCRLLSPHSSKIDRDRAPEVGNVSPRDGSREKMDCSLWHFSSTPGNWELGVGDAKYELVHR